MIEDRKINQKLYNAYCDPKLHSSLELKSNLGLVNENGELYKFIDESCKVISFIETEKINEFDYANKKMYDLNGSTVIYRNFLDWLFSTFKEDEKDFRNKLLQILDLKKGMKVLITGCGLGDDLPLVLDIIGAEGELHAQDMSGSMVTIASQSFNKPNVCFSISNATYLPYASKYFDAVFHFGGINLFGDVKKAISEMERVCKIGGRVLFGDEGISPNLRGTQYADIAINNNRLWAAETPINLLPHNSSDIELKYVLGNCFYVISFTPSAGLPDMDIDIPHKGLRGGTARTRYFGQQVSLTEQTKEKLFEVAKAKDISVHSLLEEIITEKLIKL